jgi:diguanylate cyclase (GGDEF)-like protein
MKTPNSNEKISSHNGESHALAISFSILLILAIIAISLSFLNATASSHDAIAINLAGRQRMLSQRIEKDLLILKYTNQKHSDTSLIQQDLSHSSLLFEQTLSMLSKGQLTDQDGKTFRVESTQSKNASDLIEQAYAIWSPMQTALLPVISDSTQSGNDILEQALNLVMRDSQRLMLLMDSLTSEIENAAHKKSNHLRFTEALAIGLILVNFGFVLFYSRRQLSQLAESKLLSMCIMENVVTAIIVINAKGNIEICNHSAESMFGYTNEKLQGINIKSLLDKPFFLQRGKRKNGERFALDLDLNDIYVSGRELFIISLNDLTAQKLREEQLIHLAYHDPLTALPNRLLFMDRLAQTIARAHRNSELAAVLFIDLDRFKQVNDSLGHATGDLLLQTVASRLKNCLREGDTLARLGGDEFTMIIETVDANNCKIVTQKILSELNKDFQLNGHDIQISGSIGASLYPQDSSDIHALLHYADIAMYQAKAMGGNTCCKYPKVAPAAEANHI